MRVTNSFSPVWVLVNHSEFGREVGLVHSADAEGNILIVLVRRNVYMRVPDEAEVVGHLDYAELARLLGISG